MAGNKVYVQGNYIDVHDNGVVNISIDKANINVNENLNENEGELPACLNTEEANDLWQIAKEEGWVDEALQPKALSRPDAALLAARMAKVLGIEGWVPFEQLWHRQNMRQDYNKSQYNQKTDEFEKELKRKLK